MTCFIFVFSVKNKQFMKSIFILIQYTEHKYFLFIAKNKYNNMF